MGNVQNEAHLLNVYNVRIIAWYKLPTANKLLCTVFKDAL
jgi:hypothetical protein